MIETSLGLKSRRLILRPLKKNDEPYLYQWNMDPDVRHMWTQDRDIPSYDRFIEKYTRKIKNRFDLFFMIQQKTSGQPIGFIYDYASDSIDRNAYLCLYIDENTNARGAGIESAAIFMNYLFMHYNYRKLYSEVYEFNTHALSITRKAGFQEEGCLKDYRYWNGKYWDQYIFSITAQAFSEKYKKYEYYFNKH
ncbi:MAG: GNAT family N-acetyltransferase [Desulfobacterales bacterium]|nr:GNAT family N-acetyltransferase [Desulfobacterales bacterium]MCP4158546.1 GNAT family N-acetyltransferase [Deltaproteobacteria bacterium]